MSDKTKQDKTKPEAEKAKEVKGKPDGKEATLRTQNLTDTENTEEIPTSMNSESSVPSVLPKKHPKADQSTKKKEVKASPKLTKIIQEIEKLSVLELADLVKALEDKFGVTAAAPVAVAAAGAPAAGEAPAAEEKSEFDVVLKAIGDNKISAIKAVREIKPDLGLKDAKELVEAAPKDVLKAADKKTAEEAKKKLEAAGCQVELK